MRKSFVLVILGLFLLAGGVLAANFDINSYSYDPAPATPGKQISLWVNLKNTSNNIAENVSVTVSPNYPFSVVPGEEAVKNIGSVGAYQVAGVYTKILVDEKAANGAYGLQLKIKDSTAGEKTVSVTINIIGKNPRVELVESSATRAYPGQELPLQLKLRNIGGSSAKNVVVKIVEDRTVTATGVVVSREIIALGASAALAENLLPDGEATVQMTLGINKGASLQNYSLPVTIQYYDENGTAFSSTGYLGLNIAADPEIDTVINSISPLAFPSGTSEIGVNVFNIGAASASYVVAEVSMENAEFPESKIFIGTLDPDDFDSFTTTAKINSDAKPGTYGLKVKLTFKDEGNTIRTIEKSMPVTVVSAAEAQSAGGNALLAVVGIIGLLLELLGLYVAAKWAYGKARKRFGK